MEWSKYSCVHQGAHAHAAHSRRLTFRPDDCTLPDVVAAFPRGRRLVFRGDSLIRQVFIALACLLSPRVTRFAAPWPRCPTSSWPCHDTRNCVRCGPHSGFPTASVHLGDGGSLHFGDDVPPSPNDVHVVEVGVHGNDPRAMATALLRGAVADLLRANRTVVWLITPQDAFRSAFGDGRYDATGGSSGCAKVTPATRSAGEWRALREHSPRLAGVVELAGLNEQGDAKVGGGVGAHGDCQHYCMPGVPDLLARAVVALVAALSGA